MKQSPPRTFSAGQVMRGALAREQDRSPVAAAEIMVTPTGFAPAVDEWADAIEAIVDRRFPTA